MDDKVFIVEARMPDKKKPMRIAVLCRGSSTPRAACNAARSELSFWRQQPIPRGTQFRVVEEIKLVAR